jgi:predicted O-methyltransferase YrrM
VVVATKGETPTRERRFSLAKRNIRSAGVDAGLILHAKLVLDGAELLERRANVKRADAPFKIRKASTK